MRNGTLFANTTQGAVEKREMRWQDAKQSVRKGIFISHKQEDLRKAIEIGREVTAQAQVPCYVDQLDPNVGSDSADLVTYIQEVIHQCRSLLAVMSNNTQASWWVPLEIGVALETQKFIGSYNTDHTELPSYLWSWPTMTTNQEAAAPCPASTIFAGWRQSVLPVHLLGLAPLLGSVGPVAGDVKLQDDGVVHDPVNRRGGGHGVGKDALPLGEDQV